MTEVTSTVNARTRKRRLSRGTTIWIVVIAVVLAAAIAALAWMLTNGFGGAAASEPDVVEGKPVFVSESELKAFGDAHAPVYWAGPMADVNYELTQTSAGAVFIRYVPKAEEAGTSTESLTVATYPEDQGYQRLEGVAAEEGAGSQITTSGALVVVRDAAPTSTYFSFPDAAFQVEVFSPTPDESKQKVLDGQVTLLGSGN